MMNPHKKNNHSTSIVYGIHAVNALMKKRPQDIISLHIQEKNQNSRLKGLCDNAEQLNLKIEFTDSSALEKLSSDVQDNKKIVHQGIIALIKPNKPLSEKQLQHDCQLLSQNSQPQLWIVLDNIQDPQNLGAILRNAESCACNGIIAPNHHSAPLNQTARKIASGAAELINFYQVSNLARAMTHLQQSGIWTIALDSNSEDDDTKPQPQNLFSIDLTHHIAFVLGAEGLGLRQKTKQYCDQTAYLPMLGNTESLNVAHATTVALFETIRQRQSL